MKKLILFTAIGFILSFEILGQSVKIIPKTVTYTRPKPSTDFRKTFTITYPIVSGISPKLAKKIEDSISYKKVLSFKVEDEMGDYQWLEEGTFEVGYNKKGVLSIYLSFSGTAAYPTYFGKNAVIDLKTGDRVTAKDVFVDQNSLVREIRKIQKAEINYSIKEIKAQSDFRDVDTDSLFKFAEFKKIHLEDFSVNDQGVTFSYSYSFPRIYMTIEPSGNYFLSWKEIKRFIKPVGLLGKFIH